MKRFFKKGDIAVIVLILLVSAAGLIIRAASGEAVSADIIADGRIYETCPLNRDRTIELNGTVIEIAGGKIRFLSSDCPDRLCVKSGWLDRSGDIAACVPNRVVIRLAGDSGGAPDGVTG